MRFLIIFLTLCSSSFFLPTYFVSIYNISLWQTNCKSLSSSRMQIGLELSRQTPSASVDETRAAAVVSNEWQPMKIQIISH